MLSTKIRTIIATLATAFTVLVAIGPLAPAAQAEKNDGRFMRSVVQHVTFCQEMQQREQEEIAQAVQMEGDYQDDAAAETHEEEANETRQNAKLSGCGWAQ
jgi:hypothetical protein